MSDTKEAWPDIATIQPDRLIKYRISDDRFYGEVLFPGLWYTDFDRKTGGKWTIWSIANLVESTRAIFFRCGWCYFERIFDEDHTFYVANSTCHITNAANKLRRNTHWIKSSPILAKVWLVYLGNSSCAIDTILYDYKTGTKLSSVLLTCVYIDIKSRKPTPFPDWFKDAASKIPFLRTARPPERFQDISLATNSYRYETKALYSDIDGNGHVNQATYIKWCSDAEIDAVSNRFYADLKQEDSYYVGKIEVKYVKEGVANDQYVVATWQDTVLPLTVNFVILKQNQTIFVAKFTYNKIEQRSNL